MDCTCFARILADFEEGKLTAAGQLAAAEHIERCDTCRQLLEIARGGHDVLPENQREDFTRSVLERTSGPVCGRVEASLWDFAVGELGGEEAELMALHLNHCAACKSIAADLAIMKEMLPTMAEIEPDALFVRDVVAATCGQLRFQPDPRTRLQAWWNRVVQRPLFSFEVAYVGALLLFVVFSPLLPFRDIAFRMIPSKAIQPSAKYVASIWAGATEPASLQMRKLSSTIYWSDQTVFSPLGGLAEKGGGIVKSALDKSIQGLESWSREGSDDLASLCHKIGEAPLFSRK